MISPPAVLLNLSLALAFGFFFNVFAQDASSLKSGVVRIQNSRSGEVGSGFIVKVAGSEVYIVTAAHVVRGDRQPRIYLFGQPQAVQGELLHREDDDVSGLALVRLTSSELASSIKTLKLGSTAQLGGGEDVRFIGFPDGVPFWTIGTGAIARIEGRNLVFSGAVRGGNSGGPVVLKGLVVGIVTDVSQSSADATRSEAIEPYVNGIVPNLVSVMKLSGSDHQSNLYSYQISGSINGQPITDQKTTEHAILLPFQGKLRTFDLTIKQLTNGAYCDVGIIRFPSWNFPLGSTNDRTGKPRINFAGGVQNARNSQYLELLLNPGTTCK